MADRTGPMTCPIDGATLMIRQNTANEIDYCPQCRGVWLDRGELDKIIERSASEEVRGAQAQPSTPPPASQGQPYSSQGYYESGHGSGHGGHGSGQGRGRRRSFLGDLFD